MQALFFMQIQNLKSDFRFFDFLLFLGIKSETNQYYVKNLNTKSVIQSIKVIRVLFKDFKPENSLKLGPKVGLNRCFERYSRGDLRENKDFCGTTSADISTASQMVYKMPRACTNGLL